MTEDGLERFVTAQAPVIARVRAELAAGRKESHWMWFVFPQLRGLGSSAMAQLYGLADADEARAYDAHATLGPRLQDCAALVLGHSGRSAAQIMGAVDAMKLRSCATLFREVSTKRGMFSDLIDTFYGGEACQMTMRILEKQRQESRNTRGRE
ncbi:DUF1810 domain-containing protein [Sulfitobacter sp. D35]|uniref:DUF1810 domain-containing protein n=1 Tax=Sulfitobacter sp. D35 TaxID=3083252 RepID=UPI00296E6942|nr:DUF1810 domain-containing protein [Sulfitobacter sp. D35]MDW4498206.1 DUF1810 domain-containing protein [Sulfitobacter sp. D35]